MTAAALAPRRGEAWCPHAGGMHRVAYVEWGDPSAPRTLFCVHGLTRTGRDFDPLAQALSGEWRVICPDVVGRGRSDWLPHPAGYSIAQYVSDMIALLAQLRVDALDWVGTSMGGLIGIGVAALPESPVRSLVLNDVGPRLQAEGLAKIASYAGTARRFPSRAAGLAYLRGIMDGFGPHSDAQWRMLNDAMLVAEDAGPGVVLHYDPQIAQPFRAEAALSPASLHAAETMLWTAYDAIQCPILVLRGACSTLLGAATVDEMLARAGGRARAVEIAGVGHAPTLVDPAQIAVVRDFLQTVAY
ncbi:alpha/beta fold hydrolase [Chitinasiproducens palmae]|uniref:Pimeloyl-ACP methyl ester carboxylesterase n=1 Tax=Chitinasiproducens palmae TaxID=1770053 RepID=A0A1H2PSZ4_9BURK|nr:alpha/beta hydrolase [Chitinasiproducens palmae]SDV50187.1 Pimeloyl-ACP methyl ester carboxylesterase [Chitinasiproducens palmae]